MLVEMTDQTLPDFDDLPARLRRRRKAIGMTLVQVGEACGLSAGFISQIERGIASPSLSSLAAVASALGVGTDHFVRTHRAAGPFAPEAGRMAEAVGKHAVTYERVSRNLRGGRINAVVMNIPPGHQSRQMRHDGEELVFVLQGEVLSTIDGERRVLQAQDSAHFDSGSRHNLENVSDVLAKVLWIGTLDIFGADGARVPKRRPRKAS